MQRKTYGVDKYLYANGLNIHPNYRGYGLGRAMLKLKYNLKLYLAHDKCKSYTSQFNSSKFLKKIYKFLLSEAAFRI